MVSRNLRELHGEAKQVSETTLGLSQALPLSGDQIWSDSRSPFLTSAK